METDPSKGLTKTLSMGLGLPVEICHKILSMKLQMEMIQLVYDEVDKLPYYWRRFGPKFIGPRRPPETEVCQENFEYLYRMTYYRRLGDRERWVWRSFANLRGIRINPYKMERCELALKYRRLIRMRVRPTRVGEFAV